METTPADEVLEIFTSVYNGIMKNHLTQEQIRSVNKEFVNYLTYQYNAPQALIKVTGISEFSVKNILKSAIQYYSKATA
jgi:hypothetical protein